MSETEAGGARGSWRAYLLVALAVLVAYAPILRNGFVYDDLPYVLENPAVVAPTLANVLGDTFPPGRRDTALYRPLLTLTYVVDRALSGGDPVIQARVAHGHNLLLHAAVSLLLLAAWRRLVAPPVALVGVMFYAVHPALSETVAWVAARSEGLLGLWAALGLWCAVRGGPPRRVGLQLAVLTVLAVLSKESGVVLPVAWALAALATRPRCVRADVVALVAPALAVALLAVILRAIAFQGLAPPVRAFGGLDAATRAVVTGMVFTRYLCTCLWPTHQTVHWPPLPLAPQPAAAWLALAAAAGLIAVAVVGLRRRRPWGLGAAWFLAALVPYSHVIFPIGAIWAERFLYVPAMGLGLMLASLVEPLWRVPWGRGAARIGAVMLVLAGVAATWTRAAVWHSNVSLWSAAARAYPRDIVARVAEAYYRTNQADLASVSWLRATWPATRRQLAACRPGLISESMRLRIAWIDAELARHGGAGPGGPAAVRER